MSTLREEAIKMHKDNKGKLGVHSKVPVRNAKDLSLAYSPGVAEPCLDIHEDESKAYEYTMKGNLVAVVSNGTAVLGLGNIGPKAAMPVMEGKALLFKSFADVDAFPICLDTTDSDKIVETVKLLLHMGVKDVVLCDTKGIIYEGRQIGMNPFKEELAAITNKDQKQGNLEDALKGADVFVGVSVAGAVTKEMVASMNQDPIIFAMANPVPEIMPNEAKEAGALVVGTGRSDFPNQVNNVLAFPGIFRGALDVQAKEINEEMKLAAVYAIAELISERDLTSDYVIPDPFDRRVVAYVASAVARAAMDTNVARKQMNTDELKNRLLTLVEEKQAVLS